MPLVFLLYALFAGCFTIAKTALDYTQPIFLVGSRMTVAGILMILYVILVQKQKIKIAPRHLYIFFLLGLFNIYLTNVFEFWGLKYLTSFKTCFIYSLSPFISAIFSYFLLSEPMTSKKWVGMLIGVIGLMPILLMDNTAAEELSGHFFYFSWAEMAVIGAAVCSVYGWILLRRLVSREGYTPVVSNGISMLMGGAMALLHSFFSEDWHPIPVTQIVPFLEWTLLLMIVSNLMAYNLYGVLLRRYTATFLSFAGFTTPLFAAFFGWYFRGEEITWAFYVSIVILFIGLFLFHQEELKQRGVVASATAV